MRRQSLRGSVFPGGAWEQELDQSTNGGRGGIMTTSQQQPVEAAPPRRGWWRRNWKRLILGVNLGAGIFLCNVIYYLFGRILLIAFFITACCSVSNSNIFSTKLCSSS